MGSLMTVGSLMTGGSLVAGGSPPLRGLRQQTLLQVLQVDRLHRRRRFPGPDPCYCRQGGQIEPALAATRQRDRSSGLVSGQVARVGGTSGGSVEPSGRDLSLVLWLRPVSRDFSVVSELSGVVSPALG